MTGPSDSMSRELSSCGSEEVPGESSVEEKFVSDVVVRSAGYGDVRDW